MTLSAPTPLETPLEASATPHLRYGEIWGDMGRYGGCMGEVWGRYGGGMGEVWGDMEASATPHLSAASRSRKQTIESEPLIAIEKYCASPVPASWTRTQICAWDGMGRDGMGWDGTSAGVLDQDPDLASAERRRGESAGAAGAAGAGRGLLLTVRGRACGAVRCGAVRGSPGPRQGR